MSVSGEPRPGRNKKRELARVLAQRIPQPKNEPEFTFGGSGIEKVVISTQGALVTAVEQQIDVHLGGVDLLFTKNKIATSTNEWAQLVDSYLETTYVLEDLDIQAVRAAVLAVKNKHRVQILSNMANNLEHHGTEKDPYIEPYSVEDLKNRLQDAGAFLEATDNGVLKRIFEGTVGQEEDYRAGWIEEDGEITTFPAGRDDLVTLIGQCGGNLHSTQIGTVVGGTGVKGKVKKVAGLTYTTARIDRQNPPPGAFNVQYQVGEDSHACVIFDLSDPSEVVLEKLLASFDTGRQLRSPRVGS
jgi:hypothetical protein